MTFGNTITNNMYLVLPRSIPELSHVIDMKRQMRTRSPPEKLALKAENAPPEAEKITLGNVLDRLGLDRTLSWQRSRDLRSAIQTLARLMERDPAHIVLDLAFIRHTFDTMVPPAAKISRKRWWNLRSDVGAAIQASGLHPILRTRTVQLSEAWTELYRSVLDDQRITTGMSRFARWASMRSIEPASVDDRTIERFIVDLEQQSLVRHLKRVHRQVARAWNMLVRFRPDLTLKTVAPGYRKQPLKRIPWDSLPESFRTDVDRYLQWCARTDPFSKGARPRALAPRTRKLRRDLIHAAVAAALGSGIDVRRISSLASLVEYEAFRDLLRYRWRTDGGRVSARFEGIAQALIAIASEWVRASPDEIAALKNLSRMAGSLPLGLTEKNKSLLRNLDDPRLLHKLVSYRISFGEEHE
jgi:hypothetical protein